MLNIKLAKNKMENEEGINHLLVEVSPLVTKSKIEKPIAFVLVLDNSGSMDYLVDGIYRTERTTKLDYVKQASKRLLDMMKDGDMLGVVSFSNIANIEYPLVTLTQDEKFKIKDRINSLGTLGATNVSDGLETAYHLISEELKKTHHIKLLLLSDGEANNGITDVDGISTLVNGYRQNDVSISTIGVGVDYNAFYMESIATSSGGMFYHLEDMKQLNEIFTQELKTLATLTTKQAKINVTLPEGIFMESNLNGFKEDLPGTVFIGNVFSKQSIVFEIYSKEEIPANKYPIAVTFSFTNEKGQQQSVTEKVVVDVLLDEEIGEVKTDESVVNLVKKFMQANAQKVAIRSYEIGNIQEASGTLQTSMLKMNDLANAYGFVVDEELKNLNNLNASMSSRSVNKSMAKEMYSQSYSVTRNIDEKK